MQWLFYFIQATKQNSKNTLRYMSKLPCFKHIYEEEQRKHLKNLKQMEKLKHTKKLREVPKQSQATSVTSMLMVKHFVSRYTPSVLISE
jgi:hypothetical protein